MFFIFGWGKQTVKNHGPVFVHHCDNCNNDRNWNLYSRKTWFTLFFIPVIPYSSEHLLICPICNYGVKLDRDKFKELKDIAECNMDLENNKITREEHETRIKTLISGNSSVDMDEESLSGKTETQKNYIKQMREIEEQRNSFSE